MSEPEPELQWLIENIWVDQSRGLIAGNPGVGKTWLALDMLISVASGQPCLGKYAVKQAPVLLVEEEASRLNLARRAHSLARARGLSDSDLTSFFHITRQFVKMPADIKEIYNMVIQNGIKLVVFDSLRRFHSVNENSSSEMQGILDCFGRLNTMGETSVALIHHLSKSGKESDRKPLFERLRGSSDLWAWRDCILGVEGEEDAAESLLSFQFRDAEAQSPVRIKRAVDDLSGAISLQVSALEESEEFLEKAEFILSYVKSQYGPVSRNQICENVKGRKADIMRSIKLMEKRGMLALEGLKLLVPEYSGTNGNHGN